ncbi:MAG: hypothetical protein ACRCYZ_03915 [Alphaproteobacteria bacterium]
MTILEKFSTFSVFLLSALCFQLDFKHQNGTALLKISSPSKESSWAEKFVNRKKGQISFLKTSLPDGDLTDSFLSESSASSQQSEVRLMFESFGKEAAPILLPIGENPRKFENFSSFSQRLGNVWKASEPAAGEALTPFHLIEGALDEGRALDDGEMGADVEESPPKLPVEEAETLREALVLPLEDLLSAKKQMTPIPDLDEVEVVANPKPPEAKLEAAEKLSPKAPAKKALFFLKPPVEEAETLRQACALVPENPVSAQKQPDINLEELEEIVFVSEPVVRGVPCDRVEPVKASEQNKLAILVAVPVEETLPLRKASLKSVEPEHKIAAVEKPKNSIFRKVSKLLAEKFRGSSEKPDRSKFSYYGDRGDRFIRFGLKPGV